MAATNAAVVGIMAAALYKPVWTSAVTVPADFAIALSPFVLLTAWWTPPWLEVLGDLSRVVLVTLLATLALGLLMEWP